VSALESGETPFLHTPGDLSDQLVYVPCVALPLGFDHSFSELRELKD
jgi:hypothetical protein